MSPQHELILGGARGGKSRAAEQRAAHWLQAGGGYRATLVATAWGPQWTGDLEMGERIARHRADRAARLARLETVECALHLGATLRALDDPRRLIVVDCLTLWLTQCLMPPPAPAGVTPPQADWASEQAGLFDALRASRSPIVLVSNEIGLGVTPLAPQARACVDALGRLHQDLAACCARVTLMVAGCALPVKGQP